MALLLVVSGCGLKTPPLPPQDVVPRAIDDLRFTLDEKGVELNWSYPQRTEQGQRLEAIAEFEIYRAVVSPDEYCQDCPLPFGSPRTIAGGKLPIGVQTRTATFRDTLLRPGHLYFYKVRAKGGWYYSSPDSNIVSFLWETPLAAPINFMATAGDNAVYLSWQPAPRLLDGTAYSGSVSYQLYRKAKEGAAFSPVGPRLRDTKYTDISVTNNREYFYTIRALRQAGTSFVAGEAAPAISARPLDLTPPSPPSGFTVHAEDGKVVLQWQAPADPQVAGFIVYRRCKEGAREKIGTVEKDAIRYIDHPPEPSSCFYQVSATDSNGNESPPTPEKIPRTGR